MHSVLLGVTKKMLLLWFSNDFKGNAYNFVTRAPEISKRLLEIRPPYNITRMPRSLADIKYWKASEYRSWLLFYGPIVLKGILNSIYYDHFLLLSQGIAILLNKSISNEDLEHSENVLEHFVSMSAALYEERFLTLNFHLLLHLTDNVRQIGPLWAYSCFPFENANGFILKLVRGTQSVENQILDSVSVIRSLPFLEKKCIEKGSKADAFLLKMNKLSRGSNVLLETGYHSLGKSIKKDLYSIPTSHFNALADFLHKAPKGMLTVFKRVKIHGKIFHSRQYTRVRVRNSYTVKFVEHSTKLNTYGHVECFVQYIASDNSEIINLALIHELKINNARESKFPIDSLTNGWIDHIAVLKPPDYNQSLKAVRISDILEMCIYLHFKGSDTAYACSFPNLCEAD